MELWDWTYSPSSLYLFLLPVAWQRDGSGEGVTEHVLDGELDVADEEPLLGVPLLSVAKVCRPLQRPGRQRGVELLLVRQSEQGKYC